MSTEQQQLVDGIGTYLDKNFGDRSPESMRRLFDKYDVDGDQKITKSELTQLLKDIDIGNTFTRGVWVRGILDKLDTNADHAISWSEFQTVVNA